MCEMVRKLQTFALFTKQAEMGSLSSCRFTQLVPSSVTRQNISDVCWSSQLHNKLLAKKSHELWRILGHIQGCIELTKSTGLNSRNLVVTHNWSRPIESVVSSNVSSKDSLSTVSVTCYWISASICLTLLSLFQDNIFHGMIVGKGQLFFRTICLPLLVFC